METFHRYGLFFPAYLFIAICSLPNISFAQPPITPSGLNTQVSGPIAVGGQTQFNITGGTRPGGGTNLFHSFGNFNVPNNNIANFLNNTGLPTSNILGRVTGGNVSNIFGTIQATGFGSANLFLMNPAGFLFGPNATVNVGGMVSFTTADYLRLADGVRFNAHPNATADGLLSVAPVVAFGFLGKNPGAITVQGSQLTVAGNLSLIGGNITIQGGTLAAPGGNVTLVGVGKPSNAKVGGEVSLAGTPTGFQTMGTVTLSQGSVIDISNSAFDPNAAVGSVVIRAGEVVLNTATIRAINAQAVIETPSVTVESRGSIDVRNSTVQMATESGKAGTVQLTAGKDITVTDSRLQVTAIIATGGVITLTAPTISVRGSTLYAVKDIGGGTIDLNATKGIILANSELDAFSFFSTPGGTILINGGKLLDAQRTTMNAFGRQDAGTIQVHANSIALTDSRLDASSLDGKGGLITLDAKKTTLTNSQLLSSQHSPLNSGGAEGGTIVITSPKFKQTGSVLDVSSQIGPDGTVIINGVVQP